MPAVFAVTAAGITVVAVENGGLPPWMQIALTLAALVGVITRQIIPPWTYKERLEEIKELKADKAQLIRDVIDAQQATLPALTEASSALRDAMDEIRVLRRRE